MTTKLLKDSLIYFGGNVVNQAIPFLLLPIFTRYLTPADYGITALFGSTVALLFIVVGLTGHAAVNRMYFDLEAHDLSSYVGTALILALGTFAATIAATAIVAVMGSQYGGVHAAWFALAPCIALANYVTMTNQVLWSTQRRPWAYVSTSIARSACYFGVSITLVAFAGMKWQGVILAQAAVFIGFGILSQWILQRRRMLVWRWKRAHARHILRYCLPLIPNALASWTRNVLDRIVIVALVDLHAAGIYAAAVALGRAVAIVVDSFNTTWKNHAFSVLKAASERGRCRLVLESYVFIAVVTTLGLGYAFSAPHLLDWFLGGRFHEAFALLPLIVAAEVFDGWRRPSSTFLLYAQKTGHIASITVWTAILHVVLLVGLTANHGAMGAALASATTNFLVFAGFVTLSQRAFPMPWLSALKITLAPHVGGAAHTPTATPPAGKNSSQPDRTDT